MSDDELKDEQAADRQDGDAQAGPAQAEPKAKGAVTGEKKQQKSVRWGRVVAVVVAVVAGAVPAWAASKVDPMGALRTE